MDFFSFVLIVIVSVGQQSLTDIYCEFFKQRLNSDGLAMLLALLLAFFNVVVLILVIGWIGSALG